MEIHFFMQSNKSSTLLIVEYVIVSKSRNCEHKFNICIPDNIINQSCQKNNIACRRQPYVNSNNI